MLLLALLLAFTLGSNGAGGRGFVPDLMQANPRSLIAAALGGVVFNLSNILLVAAIDIAGMAVAFPVGVGLALVIGVITTYMAKPEGNVPLLALGVGCVTLRDHHRRVGLQAHGGRGTNAVHQRYHALGSRRHSHGIFSTVS